MTSKLETTENIAAFYVGVALVAGLVLVSYLGG